MVSSLAALLVEPVVGVVHPLLFGITWMDPSWLLDRFGQAMFWVSLVMLFVECGLFFPFLPGDTLLFATGLFIAGGKVDLLPGATGVDLVLSLVLMSLAAFLGNLTGYEIGRRIGPPLYERDGRLIKRRYFDKTHDFFEKHGSKALVLGRFVPFVRTFITVVAGAGRMQRHRFLLWSLVGAVAWVLAVLLAGYFLGAAFPSIGDNIDSAVLVILAFSLVPVAWEWWRRRQRGRESV